MNHPRPGPRPPAAPAGKLLAWLGLLAALAVWWWFAWAQHDAMRRLIADLQTTYGTGPRPTWALRADGHVHALVGLLMTLWAGLGCRLFAPRHLVWLPPTLATCIALADEAMQFGSSSRSFEGGDLAWGLLGIALGWGITWATLVPPGPSRH